MDERSGYLHPRYALSHREVGRPRELPRSGGWVIERPIGESGYFDAMGCYPLFACSHWEGLQADLAELGDTLASVVLVTDPFGNYTEDYLRQCFPDLVIPFKEHYVVDLTQPRNKVVTKHHRYEARKALKTLTVERHPNPPEFLDEWMRLHDHLVVKHNITGVAAFSREAFAEQLSTPGMVLLLARLAGEPVGAILYFLQGEAAYAHILGYTDEGFKRGALYALIGTAVEQFTGVVRWLDLMGVPGAQDAGSEGIRQFKRGWTRQTRMAWLCGRILNKERYRELVEATGTSQTHYFPAYRDGELARFQRQSDTAAASVIR